MSVQVPLPVDDFFEEAKDFALALSLKVPLESAIINDWNSRRIV